MSFNFDLNLESDIHAWLLEYDESHFASECLREQTDVSLCFDAYVRMKDCPLGVSTLRTDPPTVAHVISGTDSDIRALRRYLEESACEEFHLTRMASGNDGKPGDSPKEQGRKPLGYLSFSLEPEALDEWIKEHAEEDGNVPIRGRIKNLSYAFKNDIPLGYEPSHRLAAFLLKWAEELENGETIR